MSGRTDRAARIEETLVPLLEVNDQQLEVIDRGSGDPVLFLHAFPLRAAMWDYQIEALESQYRCVAIDMPGFGGSSPPAQPERSSMQGWADLTAGVLDQLEIPDVTVVGCSMGGYLAMALLRHHPERVRRLVLADTRARSDDAGAVSRRTEQQNQVRSGAEVGSLAKGLVESLLSSASMERPELLAYVHALAEDASPEGWIGALEAMKGRADSMLVLRQTKVPALVVVGELDRMTPIAEAMTLRSLLKGDLVVVPNVGHLPNVEDPIGFNEALVNFLAGDEAGAGSSTASGTTEADIVEPGAGEPGQPGAS
jgi:3-oxoadipate enol-lactonase